MEKLLVIVAGIITYVYAYMKEIIIIVLGSVCIVLSVICVVAVLTNQPDAVFESAVNKLETNQPLTDKEKQRIDEIINWHKRSFSNGK